MTALWILGAVGMIAAAWVVTRPARPLPIARERVEQCDPYGQR